MKTPRLLVLFASLAAASSLIAQPVTLFSRDFSDFTNGGFFSYFGDQGVTGFIDSTNGELEFSTTVSSPNGGYFYGGTGIGLGNLGTFASLADVTVSFTYEAPAEVANAIEFVLKVDGQNKSANKIFNATTTKTTVSFPLTELTNTSGTFTAADLSSPNLQILMTIQNGNAWPFNAATPGTNTIKFDDFLITGTPGTPVVLYTRDQLVELALGQPVIERVGGNFILKLKLRETTNLANPAGWTDKVILPTDITAVNGELHINVVPESGNTQFYRFSTQP